MESSQISLKCLYEKRIKQMLKWNKTERQEVGLAPVIKKCLRCQIIHTKWIINFFFVPFFLILNYLYFAELQWNAKLCVSAIFKKEKVMDVLYECQNICQVYCRKLLWAKNVLRTFSQLFAWSIWSYHHKRTHNTVTPVGMKNCCDSLKVRVW